MQQKISIICVVGPTASGKTKLSVELAKHFDGEILSADSMQIYQYMSIGTAKPTTEEMSGVPHYGIDFVPPDQAFSVADYVGYARGVIEDIHQRGKLPVVVGGTGLYVSSLCDNIEFAPMPISQVLRDELQEEALRHGNEYLWGQLNAIDPEIAKKLHPNNLGRVIRAIEVYKLTGIMMSEHQRLSRIHESPYAPCMLGLDYHSREVLYSRIDQRVDLMLQNGLLDEIRGLVQQGYSKTSIQAIGYKEVFDYFDGNITLEEAVDHVKQETRRYAKRQLTWFRRDKNVHWLYADDYSDFETLLAQAINIATGIKEGL